MVEMPHDFVILMGWLRHLKSRSWNLIWQELQKPQAKAHRESWLSGSTRRSRKLKQQG
jgi:hypothetical protein